MSATTVDRLRERMPELDLNDSGVDLDDSGERDVLGVARPRRVEDIAALVRWARDARVPLHTSSSRAPHHSSRSAGGPGGGIAVDVSEMRAVRRVDRRNRVALFEAGVTFEELVPALEAAGLRAATPLCPRPGKSVLAAYLEREPTIMPKYQWDHSDPLLCLELVFGTGDIFRTGSAAGPGTIEQQWSAGDAQKSPMGPGYADWMRLVQGAQGTIGIATWCSAKAEILPERESVIVAGAATLSPLVAATYKLLRRGAVDVCLLLDARAFTDLVGDARARQFQGARPQPAAWNLIVTVSGLQTLAQRRHDLHKRWVEDELKEAGAHRCDPPPGGAQALLATLRRPSVGTHWRDRRAGSSESVFFQTTLDRVSRFCELFGELAQSAGVESERIGTYVQPQLGGRTAHVEFVLACAPGEREQTARVAAQVAEPLAAEGAFFSRPYGAWAGVAFARSPASARLLGKVKSIFDPDGILAPGRMGIGGERNGQC
jgi:FAD/FMN-containing dehydrogenase